MPSASSPLVPIATRLALVSLGASLGPSAFLGAGLVGALAAAAFSDRLFSERLVGPAANVLGNLATDFLRGLYSASRAGRNFDIERAMAGAINRALNDIQRERFAAGDHDDWFTAWRRVLGDTSQQNLQFLFSADNAANAVLLAERPDLWWPHFEAELRRWAAASRTSIIRLHLEVPALPAPLAEVLKDSLPTRTAHFFHEAVKAEPRAWVGFQQRFLTNLSSRLGAQHEEVARALEETAKSSALVEQYIERLDLAFDAFREDFARFCQDLATRQFTTLSIGESTLALQPWQDRRPDRPILAERDVLDPAFEAIEFVHREDDLENYLAWLTGPAPLAVRTIIGRAGAGKTRFAIELLKQVEVRLPHWRAGFASSHRIVEAAPRWSADVPLLVVFDYAAHQGSTVATLVRELFARRQHCRARVLLLERDASRDSGWLRGLWDDTNTGRLLGEVFEPPRKLERLDTLSSRRAVLELTLDVAARHLAGSRLRLPTGDEDFERRLADSQWQDPLYVMMGAIVASTTNVAAAVSLRRPELAAELARREKSRLEAPLPDSDERLLLVHLAACVTLAGGLTESECRDVAAQEARPLGLSASVSHRRVTNALIAALGVDTSGHVQPITPDIVGEAYVLECADMTPDAVGRLSDSLSVRRLLPALIRTIQSFSSPAAIVNPRRAPLDWLRRLLAKADDPSLDHIGASLPRDSVALREIAVDVAQRQRDLIPPADMDRRARAGIELSIRLSELGRRAEALAPAEEAVTIYRALAAAEPTAFRSGLATSLANLAGRLSGLGRRVEALAPAEEAVAIYRALAAAQPDAFRADLATSLSNLAAFLSGLGRRAEALAPAEEAVTIRRALAAAQPDAFRAGLATSLSNLAAFLSGLGRRAEALAPAEEAVAIHRRWPPRSPTRSGPIWRCRSDVGLCARITRRLAGRCRQVC